jgi:hypothetical protein
MPTFNTTDPKPGYVYDSSNDTWYPLVGIAPASQVDRWTKTAAGGETSLSGNDDNAVSLSYTSGTEQVYLNGVLLVRGQDYTATNGTTITGLTALAASDVAEVVTFNPSNILTTDSILDTDFAAKGDLISASAASTPLRVPVGTNGQVLKANSATTSGLEWGTVDADITEVVAGTGLSGGGTSGSVTLTNTVATTLDAAGDIIYASAADTPAKLSIGTAGQVLKVNSGATAPEWGTVAGSNLTEVVFTSSNTSYAIPAGVTGFTALIVGGGGGGGASSTATATNAGGGGGAGQAIERYFAISGGDTTLNITIGAGAAGGASSGAKGSNGSNSTIVGNTSGTTYLTALGGGGGGGGATATAAGNTGASGGGNGAVNTSGTGDGGGGGGMVSSPTNNQNGFFGGGTISSSGGSATTPGITGNAGGFGSAYGGNGIVLFNRAVAAGGNGGPNSATQNGILQNFGGGAGTPNNTAGTSASANSGTGGNAGKTGTSTYYSGGNGGSGLVVLRYVGA